MAIATGASAPITATSVIVVRLIALNPSPMSAAKNTPPSAHARKAAPVRRRRVPSSAMHEMAAPVHSRNIAKCSPLRPLHFTRT